MPKIIENLEGRLTAVARKQIKENGYSAVTVRSVAKECGVGVGTVYNYFPSKDALLAGYMLEDWEKCIGDIQAAGEKSDTPRPVLRCMYDQLLIFAKKHQSVFLDEAAASAFAGSFSKYHHILRSQLAALIHKFCKDDFSAEFIAEALLTWTMAGKDFDIIIGMLDKLF